MAVKKENTYDAAVLAVFVPGVNPVPHKVKFVDELGNEYSFRVDKIDHTEKALGWIKYQCQAFFDSYSTQFTLVYWKEATKWEIIRESHYGPARKLDMPY